MNTKKEVQAEKTVTINGEEINVLDYLTTLQESENTNILVAGVEVSEYYELGCLINSIISVCRGAIVNRQLETEPEEINRVLEIAQNLIPLNELQALDILHYQLTNK